MHKVSLMLKKLGGVTFVKQLLKSRVLLFTMLIIPILGFEKKSLEIARLAIANRKLQKLRRKYAKFIEEKKAQINPPVNRTRSSKIWVLWLQGIEQAPLLVKKCYESLQIHLCDYELVLLTEENYRDYVKFPDYIQHKIDSGVITKTHFSDLLRLELLEKYGGTWIDATVFCSGSNFHKCILDSDLFVYQCLKPISDGDCFSVSSWLMTSSTNNPIISLTKELLYEYWKKNDSMIDYFLIHYFFKIAIESFPEEWRKVCPICNAAPHMLLLRLFDQYDEKTWNVIKDQTAFHKLSYKFNKGQENLKDTFYEKMFKKSSTV